MRNAVIVTGPQGCGKTLRAAELMRRLGCKSVVDDWLPGDRLVPGALHLTHLSMSVELHHGCPVLQFSKLIGTEGAPDVPAEQQEVRDAA